MSLSSVAGILDPQGGLRTVVTEKWRFKYHKQPGEIVLVVPEFKVKEPVPWDEIPEVIRRTTEYVDWWISTRNDLVNPAIGNYLLRRSQRQEDRLIDVKSYTPI